MDIIEAKRKLLELEKRIEPLRKAFSNPNRKKIMAMLSKAQKEKKQMSISDIHKLMNVSYKSVYNNIMILKKADLVKLIPNPTKSGQAVTVELRGARQEDADILNALDKIKNILKK